MQKEGKFSSCGHFVAIFFPLLLEESPLSCYLRLGFDTGCRQTAASRGDSNAWCLKCDSSELRSSACGCFSGVCFVQLLQCTAKYLNKQTQARTCTTHAGAHARTRARVLSGVQFLSSGDNWQSHVAQALIHTSTTFHPVPNPPPFQSKVKAGTCPGSQEICGNVRGG